MEPENWPLQRYIVWNEKWRAKAQKFIKNKLLLPYIGIHLRTGEDWSVLGSALLCAASPFASSFRLALTCRVYVCAL
jgi:hypothetical protein